jgi:hypothetical protein
MSHLFWVCFATILNDLVLACADSFKIPTATGLRSFRMKALNREATGNVHTITLNQVI